jgi:predicted nucleotidyltransferase
LTTPDSDLDLRGVALETDLSYYFGLQNFEQQVYGDEEDHLAWSLKKFCKLAAIGNTQSLEMLFSSEDCIQGVTFPTFKDCILDCKEHFLTKKIFNTIFGYATSEHRKALGLSSRDLGDRRKRDVSIHGYSCRNASHCIRLLYAGGIALSERYFPVRLSGEIQQQCMDLKLGESSLEQYNQLYELYVSNIKKAYETSKLPEKFDYGWLDATLVEMHKNILIGPSQ